jgi:hypothetical protein
VEPFIVLAVLALAFGVLGVAAASWGVDSRDGSTDPRRAPDPIGLEA